jgi:hypothetical protein
MTNRASETTLISEDLGGRVDKSPLAFFGAQHHDHSKKGGFRRNLKFSTKSPSIQPRMELFEIRAFPQSETPTRVTKSLFIK